MNEMSRTVLASVVLAVAGCSPLPPQGRTQTESATTVLASTASAAASEPAPASLPSVRMSPGLMYDLIVAEMAGQQGDLRLAASKYLDAARVTGDPRVAKRATHIAIFDKDYATALRAAEVWVAAAPQDAEALQSLAALLIRNGRLDEAVAHLERLLALTGPEAGLLVVANLLGREEDADRALEVMQRLVGERGDAGALYAYAHLAHSLGRQPLAADALGRILARNPEDRRALLLLATVQQQAGDTAAAVASLQRAVALAPQEVELRLRLARLFVETRQLAQAREQFQAVASLQPDNADVRYALGLLALEANDLDIAAEHFDKVVTLGQRRAESLFALGQIAELQEDWEEAITRYSAITEGDSYLHARLRIAGILSRQESLEWALAYLEALELAEPGDRVHVYLAEGELLLDAGRVADALDAYGRGLAIFEGNADLLYARAMAAARIDRIDILERDLKAVLAQDPDNTQALNALGYTLADQNLRLEEAQSYIRRALAQEPEDPAILDSMGWLLYRMGRNDEAVDYLRRALQHQEDGEIAAHLGEVLWVSGRTEEARRVWEDATRYAPEHAVLRATMERFLP